jgi:DNA/RNA endonuclease YhcR with UshA esterase domain
MLATPAHAHHSGAMFDMARPITQTGVVTKVEWTNPHTFMYVNVKNDRGVVEEWAIEINSPNFLRHNGWTSTTINPGDSITITGAAAKSGSKFMHGTSVELSNGVQLRS